VARDERSDDEYRAFIHERFTEVDRAKRPTDEEFARFAAAAALPPHGPVPARALRRPQASGWAPEGGGADTVVLYLATSPHLFPVICEQLGAAGLNGQQGARGAGKAAGPRPGQRAGDQPRGALGVQRAAGLPHRPLPGQALGAEPDGAALRQRLFEPLWRRESIANIQITLAESLGVGTRGDFYDRTGALRDMIQNHALQLLTMIAMEPPATNDADAIRDEKLKVLRSLKPFTPESVARDVVRGQYRAGTVDGKAVPGYLDE
jgi:glucose-6-phosphate 1-dehydrogenase